MDALKISALIGASIALRIAWVQLRRSRPARRRLQTFLRARGITPSRIRVENQYGWPAYLVVFNSAAEAAAFRQSSAFLALLKELESMHEALVQDGQPFNARLSVRIEPVESMGT